MKSIEEAFKEAKIEAVGQGQREENKSALVRRQSAPVESQVSAETELAAAIINKVNVENAHPNLGTFAQRSAGLQAQQATAQQQALKQRILTERVGDWVCLNCNNLNFSFRDFCNRCDMDRKSIGKTITSAEELASLQAAPINTKEQFNLLSELAMSNNT